MQRGGIMGIAKDSRFLPAVTSDLGCSSALRGRGAWEICRHPVVC